MFQQLGMTVAAGGAASTILSAKPVAGWQHSLQPGDAVAGVLVTGDMSVTGLGTVTYNDGKHVLAFGHSVLQPRPGRHADGQGRSADDAGLAFQPNKMANATEIVGALKQDRHSGIMGELGATADMIPVTVKVRSLGDNNAVRKEKDLHFNVFVQQKWTPYLMMLTLFNSISELERIRRRDHLPAERQSGVGRRSPASRSPPCWPPAKFPRPRPCSWPAGGATSSTACS